MLFKEIIAVYCKDYVRRINTLCGENTEFLDVKSNGAYCDQWLSKFRNVISTCQWCA
jgi:hypothetical protein